MPRVVQVHNITYTDSDGRYSNENFQPRAAGIASIWEDYLIESRYEKNPHRYLLGTTDSGKDNNQTKTTYTTSAIVQLCQPTLTWVADWTCARFNSKPFIPSTDLGNSAWVLLDEKIEPGMITLAADGATPLYRISGTYVFGCLFPDVDIQKDIEFSIPPWVDPSTFTRTVEDGMFKKNIISRPNPKPLGG